MSTANTQAAPAQPPQLFKGIVKQALSGDSIIIRGQPKGGPLPERQLNFSNITAPRLARRPGGPAGKADEGKDEPCAWEAREFLRKKVVGKEVTFVVDYKVPASGREYGTVYLGKDTETGENVTENIVREGFASVRKEGKSDVTKLIELEEQAKSAGRGRWAADSEKHIRDIVWQVENPRQLLNKFGRKPVSAVVEHVIDGSTIRVFLVPSFNYITLMMLGIRCPGVKLNQDGKPDPASKEPFSEEAKFFTESRLLQRDVEIILESVNNANLVGSIIHPDGNIAELLLKDGFARCIDWSVYFATGGPEKLRAAERYAKKKKLRIWKDYTVSAANNTTASLKAKDKEFVGTVIECVNADALVVRLADGSLKKIFLASIRPPRPSEQGGEKVDKEKPKDKPVRPLYDIPFMYEAREYLRKKLIGKKIQVSVDYIQPAPLTFPEKICCTVKHEGANLAEALISKGYATVIRYRQDDDQRASEYNALLAAEAKAQKGLKGLHGKDIPVHHVVDLSGDAAKSKLFLPYLQSAGKISAVVECAASRSRMRLYLPRETRLITFLLAGISCPRAGRAAGGLVGVAVEGEPFGEEALAFTKDLCHQREVEIEVDSIDKAGNFIGFLFIENKNLSVALVEEGLATVHFSAERTQYNRPLQIAEGNAKARRAKIWQNYEDTKDEIKPEDDKAERKVDQKPVVVTEITPELHVFVQYTDDGDKLEALMNDLRRELNEKPPLTGAYTPKKGDFCSARYSRDGQWYRARVEKTLPDGKVVVVFMNGRKATVKASECASRPAIPTLAVPPFAKEYALACVNLPTDEDMVADALYTLRQYTNDGVFLLNVEYKASGVDYITLADKTSKEDIAQNLVKEGLLLVDNRKERRLQKLVRDYQEAEKEAKAKKVNIWKPKRPQSKNRLVFETSKLRKYLGPVLHRLERHEHSGPFLQPVDAEALGLADYNDIVKRPMDLSTVSNKLETGTYTEPWEFIDDIWLMLDNAKKYNRKTTKIYKGAEQLGKLFDDEIDRIMQEKMGYCCGKRLFYTPPTLFCVGKRVCIIPRDATYYSHGEQYIYCKKCFLALPGDEVPLYNERQEVTGYVLKDQFDFRRNDYLEPEPLVPCRECGRLIHQICCMYLDHFWPDGFICENCRRPTFTPPVSLTAETLIKTRLSQFIESRVSNFLITSGAVEVKVTIRVVSSRDKLAQLSPRMKARFPERNGFPYRAKAIFAFLQLEGHEIAFFGMHVQEYGSDCPFPNNRRVYIGYLDSVQYFRPRKLRTAVYQEILLGYLDYVRQRGFHTVHIWACPPGHLGTGNDYVFPCHPPEQKMPQPGRLQEWYKAIFRKGKEDKIVIEFKVWLVPGRFGMNLHKYIVDEGLNPVKDLPYFEGDFWPMTLEDSLKDIDKEEEKKKKKPKKTSKTTDRSHPLATDLPTKMINVIKREQESFLVVILNTPDTVLTLSKPETEDADCLLYADLMDGRDSLLSVAMERHYEFSSYRRARFSTMLLLFELSHSDQDQNVFMCSSCNLHFSKRVRCVQCESASVNMCFSCHDTERHVNKEKRPAAVLRTATNI